MATGFTYKINGAERHLLLLHAHSQKRLRRDNSTFPTFVVNEQTFETLGLAGGVQALIYERRACFHQACSHFVPEVILFHYCVESKGVPLNRRGNSSDTRNDKKSKLLLGSHCRKARRFGEK